MGRIRYQELQDGEWLRQKYEAEGLSTKQIADLVGSPCPTVVGDALSRHGIQKRNKRDATIRRFEGDGRRVNDGFVMNRSVVIGGLLGDAYLKSHGRSSESGAPAFAVKHKDLEHIRFVSNLLFPTNPTGRIFERRHRASDGRPYTSYEIVSLTHDDLSPLFREWYPERTGYRKVVPESVELDEVALLHWFLDDGSSRWQSKTSVEITLCTESFSRLDQERLCDILGAKWGVDAYLSRIRAGTGWRMKITERTSVDHFYSAIGQCPVSSLDHKWKRA